MTLDLGLLFPELIVVATGLGVILSELLLPSERRHAATAATSALGLGLALVVLILMRPQGIALKLVSEDGLRFLMLKAPEASERTGNEIILVQNWLEELKRLVPID